jgi:hypothetical protein
MLSNRLLMGLCESEHSERSMIAKLKTESVTHTDTRHTFFCIASSCSSSGERLTFCLFLPIVSDFVFRCGYQWTNKLEGMFKDVQLSKDLMSDFRKIFDSEAQLDIALDVNVVRN